MNGPKRHSGPQGTRWWLLVLPATLLLFACGGYPTEPVPGRAQGDPAPDFRLPSAQGSTIRLG